MKQWYVIQVFSGYEIAAKEDLERRIAKSQVADQFGEILVPSAKFKTFLTTEEIKREQLFPGYILIEMELTPISMKLVLSSIRVSRFLGGLNPKPLSDQEVSQIRAQITGEVSVKQDRPLFSVGREIEIHEGPFAGFMGVISTVDDEHEKLTVMVSIFGRMTPVELGFRQVK
jgi:transcription termination/antitermination protein NusG